MAVVTKYGKGVKDPASNAPAMAQYGEGRVRCISSGGIAVSATDSIASKHYLGKLPSNAVVLPQSTLVHGALTGLTIYNIGLELNGAVVDADALAILDLSTAGSKNPTAGLLVATGIAKPLWQVIAPALNPFQDPGVTYDLVGSFGTAATAAGLLELFMFYTIK